MWATNSPRLVSFFFPSICLLLTSCVLTTPSLREENVSYIVDELSETYWPGYQPLNRPVAITEEESWTFINGPCDGMSKAECEFALPDVLLVKPVTDFILESPDSKRIYSVYRAAPQNLLLRRIAHEQFHVFQRSISFSSSASAIDTNWMEWRITPSSKEIAAVYNELEAFSQADADDFESLSCLRQAHEKRIAASSAGVNDLLSEQMTMEGSAQFVEYAYATGGNLDVINLRLNEMLQTVREIENHDWPSTLTLYGYYMGAKAYLLKFQAISQKPEVEFRHAVNFYSLSNWFDSLPTSNCLTREKYGPGMQSVEHARTGIMSVRKKLINEILNSENFFVLPLADKSYEFKAGVRAFVSGGIIVADRVVLHQEGTISLKTDAPVVLLRCADNGWKGVLINDKTSEIQVKDLRPRPVSLERAKQLIYGKPDC